VTPMNDLCVAWASHVTCLIHLCHKGGMSRRSMRYVPLMSPSRASHDYSFVSRDSFNSAIRHLSSHVLREET